ncbi:MAG: SH3 domain-containing protein, partial [Gammaproteobacteria bacterium]|nr:SH3 domain-containing protein [Gammaproteobacteria bacterium]
MSGNIIKIKLLFLVLISQLTFSELILAARGDVFYITGSLVNIREKSTTESKVVALISKGRQVEEITRQAGWVKVKILGTNKQGWIHTALLSYRKPVMSPAEEELISHAPVSAKKKENVPPVAAIKKVETKPVVEEPVISVDPLKKFTNNFNLFKDKKMAKTGTSQFGDVDNKGDGVLHIRVSDDWVKTSTQNKKNDLKHVFDIWY